MCDLRLLLALLASSVVDTRVQPSSPTISCAVLEGVLVTLRPVIDEARASVTYDPLPTVAADAVQLEHLFINLITNALKFRGPEPPAVHVSATPQDGGWVFSVRDNGIGIDPDQVHRLFVMFQRLHSREQYPGTGIGLAICRKIVERHGGRIWVESAPGRGATFHFTLSRRLAEARPATKVL